MTHGVNSAQAFKGAAMLWRQTGNTTYVDASRWRLDLFDQYHGVPSGLFQADEHLAGNGPNHGTETCAVVEFVWSLNVMAGVHGDARYAERAELVAYNAIPAAMDKLLWSRVYLQSSNWATQLVTQTSHPWLNDGPDSSIYSLEGNYACCTVCTSVVVCAAVLPRLTPTPSPAQANIHQGWPRFVQRAVLTAPDGGVVIASLGPVSATLPSGVFVNVTTEYPFEDDVTISISNIPAGGTSFYLRVPSWATASTVSVNGGAPVAVGAANGTFYKMSLSGASASLAFATNPVIRITTWMNNAAAVLRGGLLYTLALPETVNITANYSQGSHDYAITLEGDAPNAAWNLALIVDPAQPEASLTFARTGPVPAVPWSTKGRPVSITGMARVLPNWGLFDNLPDVPPVSPVDCSGSGCGATVPVTLVPYGSTYLRLTEFPFTLPA